MLTNLRDKIYDLLVEVTALNSKAYYLRAPQTTTTPYCVFFLISNETFRDTKNIHYKTRIQVSVFSDEATADTAEGIAYSIRDKLHKSEGSFTLTGYSFIEVNNVSAPVTAQDENGIYNTYADYVFHYYKT